MALLGNIAAFEEVGESRKRMLPAASIRKHLPGFLSVGTSHTKGIEVCLRRLDQ